MINYHTTPAGETANARVYDERGQGYSIQAVEVSDMATAIDSLTDTLEEAIAANIPLKDIVLNLINTTRLELLSELLLKLLVILKDSDHIKRDIALLISVSGLPIESRPDSQVAKEDFNMTRQTYSARKKQIEKKLYLSPAPYAKTRHACENYARTNRKNSNLNN
jgi:hypothetical protein